MSSLSRLLTGKIPPCRYQSTDPVPVLVTMSFFFWVIYEVSYFLQEWTQRSLWSFGQTSPRVHWLQRPHWEVLHARHEVHLEGRDLFSGCQFVMEHVQVIRGLPSWLEAGMDVSLLLADLHSFLVSYPGSYWKQQVSISYSLCSARLRLLFHEIYVVYLLMYVCVELFLTWHVNRFSHSLTGGRHPNEDGEDGDPHTGETTRRGDPGMSQQDTRSSS